MNTLNIQYALGSIVKDGLLCKDGSGGYVVSTDFDENERYEGEVKLFDNIEDAYKFIEENEYWALEPVKFPL